MKVRCDYCGKPARLVTGLVIYPHRPDLSHLRFWMCDPCSAYVGCHKNSDRHVPLGRLANAELRTWKQQAHSNFDPLWKSGEMSRRDAYTWLADQMKLDFKKCHIGMFNVEQCKRVVQIIAARAAKGVRMSAVIVSLLQGTSEWNAWRMNGIGGSDAPVIEGTSPYKTVRDLFFEKTGQQSSSEEDDSKEFIFAKGHKVEALIRKQFHEQTGVEMKPVCMEHGDYNYLRVSLDGFDSSRGVLEGKLVGQDVLLEASKTGRIPDFHFTQMQHGFMVSGADIGHWFGHDGKKNGIVVPIRANSEFIKRLEDKEHQFWDNVQNRVVPPLSDRDYLVPEDDSLLVELRDAKELAENAQAQFEALRTRAVELFNHPKIAGGGLKIFKVTRQGSLDLLSVPEIANVRTTLKDDYLEAFRKKGSESWTVRLDAIKKVKEARV